MVITAPVIYGPVPTARDAFISGVDRFCKEAGFDAEDNKSLLDTLLMPERKGIALMMKVEASRREALVKRAGEGLRKLAVGLTELTPGGHTPQATQTQPGPLNAPVDTTIEDGRADTSVWGGLGVEDEADGGTPTPAVTPAGTPPLTGAQEWYERNKHNLSTTAEDELGGRTDMGNMFGEHMVRMSPQLAAQGWKGDELADLSTHLQGQQLATQTYKTGLRRRGLSFRPGPGSSIDWSKVNPAAASSPQMQQLFQRAQQHAGNINQDYEAIYGKRKGYATRGSGFGTGPYQPQAMRGGTGAGTGAPTGGALLKGRAPAPAQSGAAAVPGASAGSGAKTKSTVPG